MRVLDMLCKNLTGLALSERFVFGAASRILPIVPKGRRSVGGSQFGSYDFYGDASVWECGMQLYLKVASGIA